MPAYFNDDPHTLIYKLSKAVGQAQAGPVYDPDAEAYFAAYGISSDVEKQRISDFYTGLKSLGAWNSLVAGYMMIQTQNIGSGTTLGEMKLNYPLSLVAGPAWTSTGILFSGNSRITGTVPTGSGNRTLFGTHNSLTDEGNIIGFSGPESPGTWFLLQHRVAAPGPSFPYFAGFAADVSGGVASSAGFHTSAAQSSGATVSIFRDGVSLNSGTPTLNTTGSDFYIGSNQSAAYTNGTISFTAYWSSAVNITAINALVKNTINQGLGLP